MQPTQTGIAVALALAVVLGFFLIPGLLPFSVEPEQDATASAVTATVPAQNPAATNSNHTTTMPNGLQITDITVGTGAAAQAGDEVTVQYVGALENGTVFDASRNHGDQGFSFTLGAGRVIQGWDQGVAGMQEGGKRRLVIPASLGYGPTGVPGVIPPNATLVFEVEVVSIRKGAN